MQPKLSICIPTYNRASYLKILLNSIRIQIKDCKDSIELIVSDNASSDETHEVVNKFIEDGAPIKYIKNHINLGAESNITNCFVRANGEYVWIVGDDDIIADGAIGFILKILNAKKYGLIYVKSIGYEQMLPSLEFKSQVNSCIECDRYQLTQLVGVMLTFISGNIINKKLYLQNRDYKDIEPFYGTNLAYLSWTYFLLSYSNQFLYINNNVIISKINNTGGYKLFETFSKNQSMIAQIELKKYPKLIKIIEQDTMLRFFPHFIQKAYDEKLNSFVMEKEVVNIIKPIYKRYFSFWIFIYPLNFFHSKWYFYFIKVFGRIWLYLTLKPYKLRYYILTLLKLAQTKLRINAVSRSIL